MKQLLVQIIKIYKTNIKPRELKTRWAIITNTVLPWYSLRAVSVTKIMCLKVGTPKIIPE